MYLRQVAEQMRQAFAPLSSATLVVILGLGVIVGGASALALTGLLVRGRGVARWRRLLHTYGLQRRDGQTLRALARVGQVEDPSELCRSVILFERCAALAQRPEEGGPDASGPRAPAIEDLTELRTRLGFALGRTLHHLLSTGQIECNQVVQVRLGETSFESAVIDVDDDGILLALPEERRQARALAVGGAVHVAFDRPGDARYEFESRAAEIHQDTFVLEHAAVLLRDQRRRHVRVKCRLNVLYGPAPAGIEVVPERGLVTDVSISGACLVSHEPMVPDALVDVALGPEEDESLRVRGRVVRCVSLGKSPGQLFRLQLAFDVARTQEVHIGQLVSGLQRAAMRRREAEERRFETPPSDLGITPA